MILDCYCHNPSFSIEIEIFLQLSAVYATRGSSMDWLHLCVLNICWSGMIYYKFFALYLGYLCMPRQISFAQLAFTITYAYIVLLLWKI